MWEENTARGRGERPPRTDGKGERANENRDRQHVANPPGSARDLPRGSGAPFSSAVSEPKAAGSNLTEISLVNAKGLDFVSGSQAVSPDARRFAFVVRKGDKQAAVIDGVVGPEYEGQVLCITFSVDSKHVGYTILRDKRERVVIDGVVTAEYDLVEFSFSPDSKHTTYIVRQDKEGIVFTDGVEGKHFEVPFYQNGYAVAVYPEFSPDSHRMAYTVGKAGGMAASVDGISGEKYDFCSLSGFSPDSKRMAYVAERQGKYFVVVDGEEGKPYGDISAVSLKFSPDSKHVVYAAQQGDDWYVVKDGEETKLSGKAGRYPYFSPDSKHVVSAVRVDGQDHFLLDGETLPGGEAYDLSYSPDGGRLGYVVTRGAKSVVIINGVASKEYDGMCHAPIFSVDSKRVAFEVAPQEQKSRLVVEGVEGRVYDQTQNFCFGPDSKHYAYQARHGDKWVVVIDGRETKDYDAFLSRPVFDSPTTLHWLAVSGGTEVLLGEGPSRAWYDGGEVS